jgi:hypothetical protein
MQFVAAPRAEREPRLQQLAKRLLCNGIPAKTSRLRRLTRT